MKLDEQMRPNMSLSDDFKRKLLKGKVKAESVDRQNKAWYRIDEMSVRIEGDGMVLLLKRKGEVIAESGKVGFDLATVGTIRIDFDSLGMKMEYGVAIH